jgi:multiple sugar transport system ATP-binding protein
MTLGDRICVMKDGQIMQVAAPLELYHEPANLFVAGFIGSPAMNFLAGTLQTSTAGVVFSGAVPAPEAQRSAFPATKNQAPVTKNHAFPPSFSFSLSAALAARAARHLGRPVVLGLRPEHLLDARTLPEPGPGQTLSGRIEICEPMGAETHIYVQTAAGSLVARMPPGPRYAVGETIPLVLVMEHAHIFDKATEEVIR